MALTISIIEDNLMCQKVLVKILERNSDFIIYKVYDSAEAALEMIKMPPDVAIVDIELPGMNGIEFVKIIKMIVPEIRCLMYSSHEEDEIISRALKNGATGYISKKSSPEQVRTAVNNIGSAVQQLQ
jgi:DNA-binding NarL/FixJ family response regulator